MVIVYKKKHKDQEPTLWSYKEDDFNLKWGSPEEAVEEYLDDLDSSDLEGHDDTVTIYGFAHAVPAISPGWSLGRLLEHLDEDYGGEDDCTNPSVASQERLHAAEAAFHAAVLAEYVPYRCYEVCRVEMDIKVELEELRKGRSE